MLYGKCHYSCNNKVSAANELAHLMCYCLSAEKRPYFRHGRMSQCFVAFGDSFVDGWVRNAGGCLHQYNVERQSIV